MADLRTRYLGMELRSPLVASSSPLTGSLDGLRRLEAAGAGAVVLPSLFEEEPDPATFERANYIKTLASHPAGSRNSPGE
jgi:dihydroorotate dehydrogenase (fumarate)